MSRDDFFLPREDGWDGDRWDEARWDREGWDEEAVDDTLRPTAERVRRVLGTGQMRPAFRDRLRRDLVAARESATGSRHAAGAPARFRRPTRTRPGPRRTPPGRRTARRRRRPALVWAGAVTAVLVAGVLLVVNRPWFAGQATTVRVSVLSNVDGSASSDPTAPLRLRFSQPLDHAATASAVRLSPATQVRSAWDGDTLTVTPVYGFTPNSAYVLTVDHAVARTAAGTALAADMHVLFGTASLAGQGSRAIAGLAGPALAPTVVAGADKGSEAVVAKDGSLLLTAAQAGPATGNHAGLVRIRNGTATAVSDAADAVCVSRTGQSIAYLSGGRIVFADSAGSPSSNVAVPADKGSPVGWINDAEVIFVGGGRLKAVDRQGRVRTLSDVPVTAGRDTVVVAPGGRYVFLRPASGGAGRLIDLQDNATHPLPGSTGDMAFSADGATAAWFSGSGGTPVLQLAASGGGPVLTVQLPVEAGDRLSGLGLSPDRYHFVYSVTAADQHAELRLATLPDGRTVAVSAGAAGQSPNWSPSGQVLTLFTGGHIDTVQVPEADTDRPGMLLGLATAFANAEVSADPGAQRALTAQDAALPTLPGITRAAVLWVFPGAGGTATARVRLTIDPTPDQPVTRQAEERLTLGPRTSDGALVVLAANVDEFRAAPAAPQVVRCDTGSSPGSVLLTFDSDLNPDTVPTAIGLSTADGRAVPGTASYDAVSRTVTVRPDAADTTSVVVRVDTGLRDIRGEAPPDALRIAVTLGA